MAWIHKDPESGLYRDEFGGTHVYDNGKTLAQQFPNLYFECPWWAAKLLDLTASMNGLAADLCANWDMERAKLDGK